VHKLFSACESLLYFVKNDLSRIIHNAIDNDIITQAVLTAVSSKKSGEKNYEKGITRHLLYLQGVLFSMILYYKYKFNTPVIIRNANNPKHQINRSLMV